MNFNEIKKDIKTRFNLRAPNIKEQIKEQIVFYEQSINTKRNFNFKFLLSGVIALCSLLVIFVFSLPSFHDSKNSPNDNMVEDVNTPGFNQLIDSIHIFKNTFSEYFPQDLSGEDASLQMPTYNQNINNFYNELQKISNLLLEKVSSQSHGGPPLSGSNAFKDIQYKAFSHDGVLIHEVRSDGANYHIYQNEGLYINILKDDVNYIYYFTDDIVEILLLDEDVVYLTAIKDEINTLHLYEYINEEISKHLLIIINNSTNDYTIEELDEAPDFKDVLKRFGK